MSQGDDEDGEKNGKGIFMTTTVLKGESDLDSTSQVLMGLEDQL
jgi:hypothetical protein